jgi:regulator of protease activity HflC (stomatin/prohibitin superfamily)
MDVSGQEILTKDKVSLRVNLSAVYKISDPVLAYNNVANLSDYIYRELQFATRETIGTQLLDILLSNKTEMNETIFNIVKEKLTKLGVDLYSIGVKDIILPGDMKAILNQVVETEKYAQANVIKRREETAATRSLLNTAKLMDQNPILLRLKELESLEKITEKIDKFTVFGGLENVLKEVIKIR